MYTQFLNFFSFEFIYFISPRSVCATAVGVCCACPLRLYSFLMNCIHELVWRSVCYDSPISLLTFFKNFNRDWYVINPNWYRMTSATRKSPKVIITLVIYNHKWNWANEYILRRISVAIGGRSIDSIWIWIISHADCGSGYSIGRRLRDVGTVSLPFPLCHHHHQYQTLYTSLGHVKRLRWIGQSMSSPSRRQLPVITLSRTIFEFVFYCILNELWTQLNSVWITIAAINHSFYWLYFSQNVSLPQPTFIIIWRRSVWITLWVVLLSTAIAILMAYVRSYIPVESHGYTIEWLKDG